MVNCSIVEFKNYGRCVRIANPKMELFVTIDVGPRVIKCNLLGQENLMFVDEPRAVSEDVSSVFGAGKRWYILGGHRLWLSPEDMPRTYYPDTEPVKYELTAGGAVFTPPPQAVNGLQHGMSIEMDPDEAKVKVTMSIQNLGEKPVTGAAWALSVMDKRGVVIVPQPDEDTGLLANRTLMLWAYTDMKDPRAIFGSKYLMVRQDPAVKEKFKFGINNTKKWAAYANHGQLFIKRFEPNHPAGNYPDNGCSCEVFTNEHFAECETLSELHTLAHGQTLTHTENWELRACEMPEWSEAGAEAATKGI